VFNGILAIRKHSPAVGRGMPPFEYPFFMEGLKNKKEVIL
jgi:hypothetical protein